MFTGAEQTLESERQQHNVALLILDLGLCHCSRDDW